MEIQQKIVVEPEGFEPEMNSENPAEVPFGWEDQLYEEARDATPQQSVDKVPEKHGQHIGTPCITCSDGDCVFQFDGLCHNSEIDIDDYHQCASRQTEGNM